MIHSFSTYKLVPGSESDAIVAHTYDRESALEVVRASMLDYQDEFEG